MVVASNKVISQTYINELMASNQLALFDDFFESDDWIEIYHEGGVLNLAGYYLSDSEDNLTKWQFPYTNAGVTTITPGGYMIVWLDNDTEQGEDHASFKLSPDGEGVYLTAPDGSTIIDSIVFPMQQTDVSYGRECDACDNWIYFDNSTPDDENTLLISPTPLLYINEILILNESNLVDESMELSPWIEIFNPNPFQVNLSGYTISNSLAQTYTLPSNAPFDLTIEADGHLLLWMDGEPWEGGHHIDFIPSSEAVDITLNGPDGNVADTYSYQVGDLNVSWGRSTDGSPSSGWFTIPTPRVTNSLFIIEPAYLAINELQSNNLLDTIDITGAHEDWFEIVNLGTTTVDLGGYYLTDRLNNPTKWQVPLDVPDSTTIAPGEYILFFADEDGSQGWNHTNFKFNNDGEALVLRSIDGFSIADSVHFGALPLDYSWGRDVDGTGPWREFLSTETTPEYCNVCVTSVYDLIRQPFSIFPNPIKRSVPLFSSHDAIIYNSTGARAGGILGNEFNTIDLPSGIYYIVSDVNPNIEMSSQILIVL